MTERYRILAKHKWVKDCTITESIDLSKNEQKFPYRIFTATINGWKNFKIYEGYLFPCGDNIIPSIVKRVKSVQKRIEEGDESVLTEDVSLFSIS